VNNKFISTDPEFLNKYHGCPYIVGIDIFISDNIPLNKGEEDVQLELIAATKTLADKWNKDDMTEEEKWELLKEIQTLCNVNFSSDSPIDLQLYRLSDRLCSMYWDIEAEEVTFMTKLAIHPNYRIPRSAFDAVVEVPFDVTTIPIPIGYHHILPLRCGKNYMTPRFYHCHNYPFFKEQQEALFDYYNERNWIIPDEFKE
jgi:lipopolysaccharide cholinephosphotransferase